MPAATYIQKLVIPTPPPGVVERPRLSRQLDAAAGVPLTVVHGPPGSGKTTAVAAWARRTEPTPAWITLDRDDRDPRRLATTLRAGFERWLGGTTPPRRRPATAEESEEVLVELLAAVADRRADLTLVLDGVAEVRDSEASGLLRSLLRYVPDDLHLVVVAGGRVPVAIGRLRLGGRLVEVDGQDLRFRWEETAALLRGGAGTDVPAAVVDEVHGLAEGHVTFAVAAAAALRAGGLDQRAWVDDVVGPHLDGLRPDQRALVADIAPLDAVSAEMADAVTGRRGSADVLADLAAETAVVAPADGPRGSFRLHRLVRRALLARIAADEPGRVAATHRAAAHWRERHGDVEGAIDEWLAAGDDRTAWGLIADHHVATWFAGGHEAVDRWVDRLPVTSAPVEPEQAAGRAALLLMVGRPDEASRWVELAATGAAAAGRADALAPVLGHLRAQTRLLWGDLEGALALHRSPDGERIGRPYGQISTAIAEVEALAQLGRFDEARRTFLAMAPWAPFEGAMAPVLVSGVHASLLSCEGRLTEALALAVTGLAQARDLVGDEGPGTAWAHLAVGTTLLEQGEVHDAVPALVRAERVARRAGLAHLVVRAATALARARWLQGHPADAFATVEAARRSPHLHPLPDPLPAWLDHAEARLHLLAGDPSEARAVLASRPGAPHPEAVVLRAWAALDAGDRALALDLLADDLGPTASLGCRIEADLLRVRSQRDRVRARRHIARAVHRGSVDGYVTVFLDHRDGVADALHDQRGTEPSPYVNDLLFLLDAGDGMRLVEALTERELAVLGALRSSRTIEAIAGDLEVSVNTLKTHVKAVYRKLEATTRSDAVRRALALRIIGPVAHPTDEAVATTS